MTEPAPGYINQNGQVVPFGPQAAQPATGYIDPNTHQWVPFPAGTTVAPYAPNNGPATITQVAVTPPPATTPPASTPPSSGGGSGGSTTTPNVKVPPRNVLDLSEPDLSPEATADLFFEEIGGQELADMLSFATVKGINQKYKVITNLGDLQYAYDPTRLVSEQGKGERVPQRFEIDVNDKIPEESFITIERDGDGAKINLVIVLDNIGDDEELEIQIVKSGTAIDIG